MRNIRFLSSVLILSLICGIAAAQDTKPLLLKAGLRTPEANLSDWQQNFSLQNENIFEGEYIKIIQFSSLPSEALKQQLADAGINLLSFIPVNSYIASFSITADPYALTGTGIISVTDLLADERLASALLEEALPVHAVRANGRIEVMVTLFGSVAAEAAKEHCISAGYEWLRTTGSGRILHLEIPYGELYTLASFPFAQFIEPCDPPAEPDNNRGRSLHRATTAFNPASGLNDYDGSGITVMLNDDGYVGPHIDFTGRIPYQFTVTTGQDHGDHCAGTILGAGNLEPRGMGMAPGAELIVFAASGYPGFDSIYNQYNTLGTRLTSTSYSNGCNAGYTSLAATMDEQVRTMPELMHVFSAGNNGTSNCGYGAGSGWGNITGGHKIGKNVIAVANVNYKDELSNSSSRGPAHDGRIKPDVAALGTSVYSTSENNIYVTKTGTSMACPGTTGTLALLYDAFNRQHSSTPDGGLMKSVLMNSADDMGNPGPDFKFGYGRINARRALNIIHDSLWHTDMLSQDDSAVYTLIVPAGAKDLRIMLYWTDYEGTVNTTKALVNDLDLAVAGPDSIWLPWVLNHTPSASALNSNATRKIDTLNNAEQVTLIDPTPGTYQIKINGTAIPMGPQRFFINWLVSTEEFLITFPQSQEHLVPGETAVVRWDALPSTLSFQLEYSSNGGSTWNSIATNIPAEDRYYDWTVPNLATGNVKLKLTRGNETFITDPFSVIGVTSTINIDWVCMDSTSISWSAVPGAAGYEVLRLGNLYMDSVAYTTTTSIVLHGIPHFTEEWFTVRAYGPDNARGRRADARLRNPGVINCLYNFDLAMHEIINPLPMLLSECHNNPPLDVTTIIRNSGVSAISNFTVAYRVNQGTIISEQVNITLQPGNTYSHTFATPIQLAGANDYLVEVWTDLTSDMFPYNDTLSQIITVASFPTIQVPFLQTFEGFFMCSSTNGCENDHCNLYDGWLNAQNERFDHTDWITSRSSTPSFNTGPSADKTLGNSNGKYLYVEASYCFESTAHLISPCIDLTNTTIPVLSFWYHMNGTGMGSLSLDILSDGIWYENQMTVIQGNQGSQWQNRIVPLSAFIGKVVNLRFRALTGSNYLSDIALDDISVVETVGLEDPAVQASFNLMPNPASDAVVINGYNPEGETILVDIFDNQGKKIIESRILTGAVLINESIDVSGIQTGIYLVRISSDKSVITRKLVITR